MTTRWLRLVTALMAVSCAVVVWQVRKLVQTIAEPSALMIAAIIGGSMLGSIAAVLTVAPQHTLRRLAGRALSFFSAVRSMGPSDSHRSGLVLIGLSGVVYAALAGSLISLPDDPADDDQGAFLQTAAEVHQSGGPWQLIVDLYGGRFAEANRHPLYIALLSIRPTVSFGQSLSLSLGVISLLVIVMLTRRQKGWLVAGVAGLLLATNMAYCRFSTRVVCDILMVLWGGIVFLLVPSLVQQRSRLRELAVGGVLGLAYLTKGTGLLMLVGALLWKTSLWILPLVAPSLAEHLNLDASGPRQHSHQRGHDRRQLPTLLWRLVSSVLLLMAGWIAIASPLLVRNSRLYGKPTYNVNSWLLFVDEFEQPVPLSRRIALSEAAHAYWDSHSLGEIIRREAAGLVWEAFILVRMLGPYPLDDGRILFGLPLLLVAVLSILARPGVEHLLLAWWTILFVVVFAWYVPVAAGERFLLPLLAPLIICASDGLVRLIQPSTTRRQE